MAETKPLIGVNLYYKAAETNRPGYAYLSEGYFDCITKAGGIPVLLPPLENLSDIDCVLNSLDGFVLCGGPDLDPRNDGYEVHPTMSLMDPRRERFDRELVSRLAARQMPMMGVGCGMQLLNVVMGGTLFYHIEEEMPRCLPHRDPTSANHRHALVVEAGSLMERVYGEGDIRVNSLHHMAIDDVAPGFAVTARCPDGVVEAIECMHPSWLALGTQFHPQATSATALDLRIFEEFIAGITGKVIEVRLAA